MLRSRNRNVQSSQVSQKAQPRNDSSFLKWIRSHANQDNDVPLLALVGIDRVDVKIFRVAAEQFLTSIIIEELAQHTDLALVWSNNANFALQI